MPEMLQGLYHKHRLLVTRKHIVLRNDKAHRRIRILESDEEYRCGFIHDNAPAIAPKLLKNVKMRRRLACIANISRYILGKSFRILQPEMPEYYILYREIKKVQIHFRRKNDRKIR